MELKSFLPARFALLQITILVQVYMYICTIEVDLWSTLQTMDVWTRLKIIQTSISSYTCTVILRLSLPYRWIVLLMLSLFEAFLRICRTMERCDIYVKPSRVRWGAKIRFVFFLQDLSKAFSSAFFQCSEWILSGSSLFLPGKWTTHARKPSPSVCQLVYVTFWLTGLRKCKRQTWAGREELCIIVGPNVKKDERMTIERCCCCTSFLTEIDLVSRFSISTFFALAQLCLHEKRAP